MQQATYSVHQLAANSVYAHTSAFYCKLSGMCKRSRASCLLVSSEDGVRRGGSAGICSNRSRWCFVGKTEEKKKEAGKWLFVGKDDERELWWFINWTVFGKGNIQRVYENDTEYLCIRDTLYSAFLYTSEILYTTETQSISASCSHTEYLCMTRWGPA